MARGFFNGGIDSATTLVLAIRDGFEPYAVLFHYGQRHAVELDAAIQIAGLLAVTAH